ncbi:MAG: DoxX family protein [candidate division KSB1 bacterium]|nr:DoxX family protein [candidate division KSB1 bacterium]
MNPQTPPFRLKLAITLLNIAIGWHFLYEGLVKLIDPAWSAAGYLMNSNGFLSGFFQWMAGSDLLLTAVDFINIAGLVIIGLFIMLGLFTRYAAIAGALLIGFYYLAQPPWTATKVSYASEGHYLLVDKNLVEIIALIVIANLPQSWYYGLQRLIKIRLPKKNRIKAPDDINHNLDGHALNRRRLVKNLVSLPFVGALAFAFIKNHGWESFEETQLNNKLNLSDARTGATVQVNDPVDLSKLKKPVSKGNIGDLQISRLICGGNLISGFAHSRDLIYVSSLLKTYFTEKKVLDTWWICEQCGINSIDMRTAPPEINLIHTFGNRAATCSGSRAFIPRKNISRKISIWRWTTALLQH